MISILKFIHVLCVMGLLSLSAYCVVMKPSFMKIHRVPLYLLGMALFALITGTLLVHPKQFTFHTPWIQTALVSTILLCTTMIVFTVFFARTWKSFGIKVFYLVLLITFIAIAHDAINKTSFLF